MKRENMKIRKAGLKDLPQLFGLWKEFQVTHDASVVKASPKIRPHLAQLKNAGGIWKKYAKKNFSSGKAAFFVAEEKGKLVAYSLLVIEKNIPLYKVKEFGYMSDLFVKPKFRGKGISSLLHKAALKWFKSKKIRYIEIRVHATNKKAHKIYKKWGFTDFQIRLRKTI